MKAQTAGIWNFLKNRSDLCIKLFFLTAISFLYLGRALNGIVPSATGDGPEYVLTTEAIYNHFTPDLTLQDAESFKKSYTKKNKWEDNQKYEAFDFLEDFLALPNKKFKDAAGGLYTDEHGKNYGYHFFFYSALNVPGRYIAEKIEANPLKCFQVTNALFVIITCFVLFFFSSFSLWKTVLVALSFCFSTVYWYLGWTHPEVYTVCLATLAFWFFFQGKNYVGIFLLSLAGLQNQPLLIMLLFMIIKTIIDKGFNRKNIFKIGLLSIIFFWPPVFYYFHFGTTNLIKDTGALSTEYITFTRVLGFYTDINQGVILAIPLVLFLYIYFMLNKWTRVLFRKESFDFNYLLPIFLIIMTCIVSTMGNWNHGQAIVNRYASWFSAIILVHLFFIIDKLKPVTSLVAINYIFVTQTFTTLYHEQFNQFDWSQEHHTPLAKWILEEHPSLYNPDPRIFIGRTNSSDVSPENSPVFYIKNHDEITKMAVYETRVDSLEQYGFSKQEIEKLKPTLHFVNGWAYLNRGEFTCSKSVEEIYGMLRNKRIRILEDKIRSHPAWLKLVEDKAKAQGKSLDEMVKLDAEYIIYLEEKGETK